MRTEFLDSLDEKEGLQYSWGQIHCFCQPGNPFCLLFLYFTTEQARQRNCVSTSKLEGWVGEPFYKRKRSKTASTTVWLHTILRRAAELIPAPVIQLWLMLENLPGLWEPASSRNCDRYFSLSWCFLLNYAWDLCCRRVPCGTGLVCRNISEIEHMKGYSISVANCNDKAELEVTCEW